MENLNNQILNEASDVSETIQVILDCEAYEPPPRYHECKALINEFGKFSFNCTISLQLNFTPEDGFEVNKHIISVDEIFNEEGEIATDSFKVQRKVGKILADNIEFDIYKK